MNPRMTVALIGPATARGGAVLTALEPLAKAIDLVGLATEDGVGASYEWQGEQAARAAEQADLTGVEAIIDAEPTGRPVDGAPWLGLWHGAAPLVGAQIRPVQRIADPVARAISKVIEPLQGALTGLDLTVLDSASVCDRAGMDELRDQTISLLNFRPLPTAIFGRRLAFDLLVDASEREAALGADLATLCPAAPIASVRRVIVPTFLGTAIDLRLRGALDLAAVEASLEAAGAIVGPSGLAEVTDAGALHASRPTEAPDGVRLWLLLDDLRWGVGRAVLDFLARIRASAV